MLHCHVGSRDNGNREYVLGPTTRSSQPVAGMLSHFNFMTQLSILAKLALACGS